MPFPTIAFGVLLSTLYAAAYHLVRGGTTKKLFLFMLLSWAGFWLGDTLGWTMGWNFGAIGILNAGMGTIISFVFILAGDLISRIQIGSSDQ
jgi:hypothetical protein